jgi:TRAP-type transport system periplasmic protein
MNKSQEDYLVMKKILILLLVIFTMSLFVFCGDQEGDGGESTVKLEDFKPKDEYTLSLVVGPQFYWGLQAIHFVEKVKEETAKIEGLEKPINIKNYYGGTLFAGKQTNEFQLMAQGAIDFAFGSTINWASTLNEGNVFSLPFFIGNYENLDKLTLGETGKMYFDAMEKKGVIGLGWGENGFRQLTNSIRPVTKPEDLRDLKIRVVGSPIFIDIFSQLGADPINMNWADATTAFQQGAVDGQENPIGVLIPVNIWEYHSYASFWDYLADPVAIGVNKNIWNSFPPEVQKVIKDAAEEAGRFGRAISRLGLDDGWSLETLENEFDYEPEIVDHIAYLKEQGMEVEVFTEEQKEAFKEATKPVYDEWKEKIGPIYNAALKDLGRTE